MYTEEPVFELKTGMMVQLRNGSYYHVLKDIMLRGEPHKGILKSLEGDAMLYLTSFDKNLFYQNPITCNPHNYSPLDIEKIWEPCVATAMIHTADMKNLSTLVWERNTILKPKTMTLDEISKALGYPVKLAVKRTDVNSVMDLIDSLFEQ